MAKKLPGSWLAALPGPVGKESGQVPKGLYAFRADRDGRRSAIGGKQREYQLDVLQSTASENCVACTHIAHAPYQEVLAHRYPASQMKHSVSCRLHHLHLLHLLTK